MSKLLRYFETGQVYFITAVTRFRQKILIDNFDLVKLSLTRLQDSETFHFPAWVFLPDHMHLIISPSKCNPDKIIQRLKMSFGQFYRKRYGLNKGSVWQARYWDHVIRDEEDLRNHIDYIHYNPVHHGYCHDPFDWDYSSIHLFDAKR